MSRQRSEYFDFLDEVKEPANWYRENGDERIAETAQAETHAGQKTKPAQAETTVVQTMQGMQTPNAVEIRTIRFSYTGEEDVLRNFTLEVKRENVLPSPEHPAAARRPSPSFCWDCIP